MFTFFCQLIPPALFSGSITSIDIMKSFNSFERSLGGNLIQSLLQWETTQAKYQIGKGRRRNAASQRIMPTFHRFILSTSLLSLKVGSSYYGDRQSMFTFPWLMQNTEEMQRESLTIIWEGEREKRMLKLFIVRDISLQKRLRRSISEITFYSLIISSSVCCYFEQGVMISKCLGVSKAQKIAYLQSSSLYVYRYRLIFLAFSSFSFTIFLIFTISFVSRCSKWQEVSSTCSLMQAISLKMKPESPLIKRISTPLKFILYIYRDIFIAKSLSFTNSEHSLFLLENLKLQLFSFFLLKNPSQNFLILDSSIRKPQRDFYFSSRTCMESVSWKTFSLILRMFLIILTFWCDSSQMSSSTQWRIA